MPSNVNNIMIGMVTPTIIAVLSLSRKKETLLHIVQSGGKVINPEICFSFLIV